MNSCRYFLPLLLAALLPAVLQAQTPRTAHFAPQLTSAPKVAAPRLLFSVAPASPRAAWSATKNSFEQGDAIGVIASTFGSSQNQDEVPFGNLLRNAKLVRYATGWYLEDDLAVWQTGDVMTAYAYWPYDRAIGLSPGASAGAPVISFQPAKNIRDQQDLLCAVSQYVQDLSKPVPLKFSHVLAQIKFKANMAYGMTQTVIITRLRLLNLKVVAGKFDLTKSASTAWTGTKSYSDLNSQEEINGSMYTVCCDSGELAPVELTASSYPITTDEPLGDISTLQYVLGGGSERGFLVIPQTAGSIQAVAIDYTIDGAAQSTIVLEFLQADHLWEAQKVMVINFQIPDPNAI